MCRFALCFLTLVSLLSAVGSPARAGKRRTTGLNELVVMDPGVNETGLPKISLQKDGTIKIPPTVHVHRYYYNGDKEYQGPFGHGGPTIIVACHPKTGKRLYIKAQLPPGAPVISYSEHDIEYAYPHRKVIIKFSRWHKGRVSVHYAKGDGLKTPRPTKTPSRLAAAVHERFRSAKKTILGGFGAARNAAATGIEKAGELTDFIPGVKALQSALQQRGEAKANEVRKEGLRKLRELPNDIRTNR